jgi:hypothetical protein
MFVDNQAEHCFSKHHQSEAMITLGHLMSHHLRIKVTELRFGHVFTSMCLGRGLPKEKMIQVNDVADLVWNIAKVPTQMCFKAVEVTPSERLEGKVMWPDAELLKLEKAWKNFFRGRAAQHGTRIHADPQSRFPTAPR